MQMYFNKEMAVRGGWNSRTEALADLLKYSQDNTYEQELMTHDVRAYFDGILELWCVAFVRDDEVIAYLSPVSVSAMFVTE